LRIQNKKNKKRPITAPTRNWRFSALHESLSYI
jgi:hypothetical protein